MLASTFAARAGACADDDGLLAAGLQTFDAGRRAFEAKRFDVALAAFEASYSMIPSPNTRLYIGRCHRALGRTASAYAALRLAQREAEERIAVAGEQRFAAARDAAAEESAELAPKVPRLTIAVPPGLPDGFAVQRGGVDVPRAAWGLAIETDPGTVVVTGGGPRFAAFRQEVTLADGDQRRVDVDARRLPTATLAVRLRVRPAGVAVALDGSPVAATDGEHDVDVGPHRLVVTAPGYGARVWTGDLADGARAEVDVLLRPDPPHRAGALPPWVSLGVGGAAVAALAVATAVGVHAYDEQKTELARSPFARDVATRDSIRSQATVADVLFVGGGVLGVGATVLALLTRWKTEPQTVGGVSLSPWFEPSAGGVCAYGRY